MSGSDKVPQIGLLEMDTAGWLLGVEPPGFAMQLAKGVDDGILNQWAVADLHGEITDPLARLKAQGRANPGEHIWIGGTDVPGHCGIELDHRFGPTQLDPVHTLTANAHTLVIEGPSYRQRDRGRLDPNHADEHPQ